MAIGLAAPAADAAFDPAFPIAPSATVGAGAPEIAIDDDGDGVAAWHASDGSALRARARTVSSAGGLGTARTLSAPGQDILSLDVASDGAAGGLVVWSRSDGVNTRIQARSVTPSGLVGALKTLSPAGRDASSPQVGSDLDGDAFVVWLENVEGIQRVRGRWVSPTGVLGPIRTFSGPGQDASALRVAVAPTGSTVVSWQRSDSTHERIQARRIRPDSLVGSLLTLSSPGVAAFDPQIDIDADGDAVVIWRLFDGTFATIQTRRVYRNQTLGTIQSLQTNKQASQPRIAVDASGDAIALWFSNPGRVVDRVVSESDTLGSTQEVISSAGPSQVTLDVDAEGDGVIVMSLRDNLELGATFIAALDVSVAGGGVVTSFESLSGYGVGFPRIAVANEGQALATWMEGGLQGAVGSAP